MMQETTSCGSWTGWSRDEADDPSASPTAATPKGRVPTPLKMPRGMDQWAAIFMEKMGIDKDRISEPDAQRACGKWCAFFPHEQDGGGQFSGRPAEPGFRDSSTTT